jgi:hypothetical protein
MFLGETSAAANLGRQFRVQFHDLDSELVEVDVLERRVHSSPCGYLLADECAHRRLNPKAGGVADLILDASLHGVAAHVEVQLHTMEFLR